MAKSPRPRLSDRSTLVKAVARTREIISTQRRRALAHRAWLCKKGKLCHQDDDGGGGDGDNDPATAADQKLEYALSLSHLLSRREFPREICIVMSHHRHRHRHRGVAKDVEKIGWRNALETN